MPVPRLTLSASCIFYKRYSVHIQAVLKIFEAAFTIEFGVNLYENKLLFSGTVVVKHLKFLK